jgi:hypothetical protein
MTNCARATFFAITASVALSACGGDDSSPGASRPEQTRAAAAADRTVARSSVLVLSDLPPGWTIFDDRTGDTAPTRCEAVTKARATTSARATSRSFDHVPTGQVTQTVYLFATEPLARAAFHRFVSAAARTCLASQVKGTMSARATKDVTFGHLTAGDLAIEPVGDERGGDNVTIDYTASGNAATLDLNFVFVRAGRGVSALALINETGTVDATLRSRLEQRAVSRLRRALSVAGRPTS